MLLVSLHQVFVADWHGVLFIRQGLYQEGVFKFSVQIPENYPDGDAPVSVEQEKGKRSPQRNMKFLPGRTTAREKKRDNHDAHQ